MRLRKFRCAIIIFEFCCIGGKNIKDIIQVLVALNIAVNFFIKKKKRRKEACVFVTELIRSCKRDQTTTSGILVKNSSTLPWNTDRELLLEVSLIIQMF